MSEIENLQAQLKVARSEIANLRSQINQLGHVQKKEIASIKTSLLNQSCENCQGREESAKEKPKTEDNYQWKPVGFIKSVFHEKRAVPRQASIAGTIESKIEISKDAFTSNPELSLESLEEFSHIWIIYNFHKNECHNKPKVYPPRLDGKSVGVFATRSPHRPNAIGMSLVKLNRVEGTTVYFYGTDMIDSTPVIDIKPYIPEYDCPKQIFANISCDTPDAREEPEGEEKEANDANTSTFQKVNLNNDTLSNVKVPTWVDSSSRILDVIFSENALQQIMQEETKINQKSVEEILRQDPRSVYVREKYLSQIYSFQIDGKNVICRFDDKMHCVTVLQIRNIIEMSD